MFGTYIVCGILLCHVTTVTCQTNSDAIQLRTDLFSTYDKTVRPVDVQTDTVYVYLNFYLLAVNSLDEVTEVLKTTGYLWILWNDEVLQWDPTHYGGLTRTFFPQDDVWKPDIALKNSFKEYKELGVKTLNVRIENEGLINWYPFQVFESTCSMDIKYFPFDVQTCTLEFVAWSYSLDEVKMFSGQHGLLLTEYSPNSAWDIISTGWIIDENADTSAISFSLKMKRKPLFIILSIVLPITLLAVLNIFVFVLPCDSGERAGYAVTVFLALAVFLTIVSATLPANSDTVAVFSVYLIIQTVQSTVITLIALFMLRLNTFDEEVKIPACIISLLRMSNRLRCKKGQQKNKVADSSEQEKEANEKVEVVSIVRMQEQKEAHQFENSTVSLAEKTNEEPSFTWKQVLRFMDIVCLIVFSAIFVLSTAICFGMSITAEQ